MKVDGDVPPVVVEPHEELPVRSVPTHRKLRRRIILAAFIVLFGFVLLNALAYFHVYNMTHFRKSGKRTANPEKLSVGARLTVLAGGVNVPKPRNKLTPDEVNLTYETRRFSSPKNGAQLEAWHIPKADAAKTVILFHGYAGNKSHLVYEAAEFSQLGYACLLVDFYGSGGSSRSDTSVGFFEAYDVLAAIDEATRVHPGGIILFGKSMGAAAVLRACTLGARAEAIILEAPFDRMVNTVGNRFKTMKLPAFPLAHLMTFWGGRQHGFDAFSHNPADYARDVDIPVLLLVGKTDLRVTPAESQALFDNLKRKVDSRLVLLPNAGHGRLLRSDPDIWKDAVGRFVR